MKPILLVICLFFSLVKAWPNGAGACLQGQASVGANHLNAQRTGTLAQGDFAMVLKDSDDQDQTVNHQETVAVVGTWKTLEIQAVAQRRLRGVLIRVGNTTADQVLPDNGALQVAQVCGTTGGVTHRNFQDKSSVAATLEFPNDQEDTWHRVDVTLVVQNSNGYSEYYYSWFQIHRGLAEETTTTTTLAPTETSPTVDGTNSIWEVAAKEADLSLFSSALDQTNLRQIITPQTLFAPTDSAMAVGVREEFWKDSDWKLHLDYLLQYHVVSVSLGPLLLSDIASRQRIQMQVDEPIQVRNQNGVVSISSLGFSGSMLVQADIILQDKAGVVVAVLHKVDTVFLPLALVVDLLGWIGTNTDLTRTAQLIVLADLEDELKVDSGRTFWAPNNNAWTLLPDFGQLVTDPTALRELLKHHISPAIYPELQEGMQIETIANTVLVVGASGNKRTINGQANILVENQIAANGLGFIIDAVLTVLEFEFPTRAPQSPVPEPSLAPTGNPLPATVWDLVVDRPELTVLERALKQARVDAALKLKDVTFTLFAPTDEAWSNSPRAVNLDDDNWKPHLEHLLLYHTAVGQGVRLEDLEDGLQLITLAVPPEDPINVVEENGSVQLSGVAFTGAQIISPNLQAGNGVVHVIDRLFLPGALVTNLRQWVNSMPDLQRFSNALIEASLEEELQQDDRTVFIPNNAAWENMQSEGLALSSDELRWLLSNHICEGVFPEEKLINGFELVTISQQVLEITVDSLVRSVNEVEVITSNNIASNGLGFVIGAVLKPKNPSPTTVPMTTAPTMAPTGAPIPPTGSTLMPSEVPSNQPTSELPDTRPRSIFNIVVREADLSLLETSIRLTGLDMKWRTSNSSLTLFAPIDDSLGKLDKKFLTASWRPHLEYILLYHTIEGGTFLSSDLTDGRKLISLADDERYIEVNATGETIELSGTDFTGSRVSQTDLLALDGVVHKIDQYFLPRALTRNLLGLIRQEPEFGMLFNLVAIAGMEDELVAEDRTFFVPSRKAWSELPVGYLDPIVSDPILLRSLLSRHICEEVYPYDALGDGDVLSTISGGSLIVSVASSDLDLEKSVNGSKIIEWDTIASNGLAFVIDSVLLIESQRPTIAPTPMPPRSSIVHTVSLEDDLSMLNTAIALTGLEDDLAVTFVNFTLFAPTNTAFESLDDKYFSENWKRHLTRIILYHASDTGAIEASQFWHGMKLLMLAPTEAPLTVSLSGSSLSLIGPVFGRSRVVQSDIHAGNGIIHKVDKVFYPESLSENLLSLFQNSPWFSWVAKLIVVAGFEQELTSSDRTFFAPSDDAFAALADEMMNALSSDSNQARAVLAYHLCDGVYPDALLVYGLQLVTISNATLSITGAGNGAFSDKFIMGAPISFKDELASNGLVHTIEAVLIPPGLTDKDVPTSSPSHAYSKSPDVGGGDIPSLLPSTSPQDEHFSSRSEAPSANPTSGQDATADPSETSSVDTPVPTVPESSTSTRLTRDLLTNLLPLVQACFVYCAL